MNGNVNGNINNSNPVILFIKVCSTMILLSDAIDHSIFMTLIPAIMKIQTQSQIGTMIAGNIFINAAIANIKSAAESNFELNGVTDSVFLAILPSIMSLNPQSRYML